MKTDNELIAEFMGAERREGPRAFNPDQTLVQWIIKGNPYNQHRDDIKHWYQPVELKYHESWDWLMPGVEKIEKENDAIFYIRNSMAEIELLGYPYDLRVTQGNSKLEATYKAVVNFIKWYNIVRN
jgi:hypothetical protein